MLKNKFFKLFDRLLPLITIAFPGGYKLLVVMLITSFSGGAVANEFSQAFFWIALLVTFSGLPLAALMVSTNYNILSIYKVLLVFSFATISFFIAYVVELHTKNNLYNLTIYVAVLLSSSYEVYKRDLLNHADFINLFTASVITVLLFSFLLFIGYSTSEYLIISTFLALLIPLVFLSFKAGIKNADDKGSCKYAQKTIKNEATNFLTLLKVFIKYATSNIFSTSLMAAFPLLLVYELGDEISANLAQVFYFSSLAYLVPRALSAKHVPNMRKNGISDKTVQSFFNTILYFVLLASVAILILFTFIYQQWLIFFLLFLAMQVSQLSLPFSNVFMVKGDAGMVLKVNMIASLFFIVAVAITMVSLEQGELRCMFFLIYFLIFQFIKCILNYRYSKKYWYSLKCSSPNNNF
jgi:hypothetical protein